MRHNQMCVPHLYLPTVTDRRFLDFGVVIFPGNVIIQEDERPRSGFPPLAPTMQAGHDSDGWMNVYVACRDGVVLL